MRAAEDALGVLIGIIDGTDDQATVTLIGLLSQVVLAREVITALAVGARSILTKLINRIRASLRDVAANRLFFLLSGFFVWSLVRGRFERLDDGPNGPHSFSFGVC